MVRRLRRRPGLNASGEALSRSNDARTEIRLYFNRVVEDLKRRPGDNLLSRLLETENHAGGLNREEIFTNSVLLLAAGHETTTNLIGNGVLALMRNRDQWDVLVREPSLVESAVEECCVTTRRLRGSAGCVARTSSCRA